MKIAARSLCWNRSVSRDNSSESRPGIYQLEHYKQSACLGFHRQPVALIRMCVTSTAGNVKPADKVMTVLVGVPSAAAR